jgi:hypothetical protein
MVVVGTLLTARVAAQELILYALGLILKNREILWRSFRIFCKLSLVLVGQFGWAMLGAYMEGYLWRD